MRPISLQHQNRSHDQDHDQNLVLNNPLNVSSPLKDTDTAPSPGSPDVSISKTSSPDGNTAGLSSIGTKRKSRIVISDDEE